MTGRWPGHSDDHTERHAMVVTSCSKGYSVHGECDNGVQFQFHNQVKKGTQCKGSHLSNGANLCGIIIGVI